jgi:hypothetical protein
MAKKPRPTPPNDISMFYDEGGFNYQMDLIDEFYTKNIKFKITLYKVDMVKSKVNNPYNETKAKDKKYLAPVELSIATLEFVTEQKFLTKGGAYDEDVVDFEFVVLMSELEAKSISINEGDYFTWSDGLVERSFKITKVTNINSSNTAYGFRPFYVNVQSRLAKENIALI